MKRKKLKFLRKLISLNKLLLRSKLKKPKKIVVPVKKNDSPKIELRNRDVKKFYPTIPK